MQNSTVFSTATILRRVIFRLFAAAFALALPLGLPDAQGAQGASGSSGAPGVFARSASPFSAQAPAPTQVSARQSVSTAFAYNPELKATQEQNLAAKLAADRARGARLPSLDAGIGGGYSQVSDATSKAWREEDDILSYGESSLRLTQPIWHGGAITSEIEARSFGAESSGYTLENEANFLALEVLSAHVDVLRRKTLLDLAQTYVAAHEEKLSVITRRYEAGVSTSGELNQVKSRLYKARATQLAYRATHDEALVNYQRLTGLRAANLLPVDMPKKTYPEVGIAANDCLGRNPRLQAALANVSQADKEKEYALSAHWPRLNLELGHSWSDRDSAAPMSYNALDATLRLSWNLYHGGQDKAAVAIQGAKLRQNKQALRAIMDILNEDVENTYSNMRSYEAQAREYKESKEAGYITREDFNRQFLAGRRTLIDVLDAENDIFSASGQEIMSSSEYMLSAFRLLALSGQLLDELGLKAADLATREGTTDESINNLKYNLKSRLNTWRAVK